VAKFLAEFDPDDVVETGQLLSAGYRMTARWTEPGVWRKRSRIVGAPTGHRRGAPALGVDRGGILESLACAGGRRDGLPW
jgi:hypothetical protein